MAINFLRTIIVYIVVVLAMRLMGKRQIGELQASELVITIMISELATIPVTDVNIPLAFGLIPIFTLVVAEIFLSYWTLRSKRARNLIIGVPSLVIANGAINKKELDRNRINSDDLAEELRQLNCTNINEIKYGIIETNGKLSLIMKDENKSSTVKDVKP